MHIYTVPQIFQIVDILFINLFVTLAGCPCVTTEFFFLKKTEEYLVTYAIKLSLEKIKWYSRKSNTYTARLQTWRLSSQRNNPYYSVSQSYKFHSLENSWTQYFM